jgi:hypothetical protein
MFKKSGDNFGRKRPSYSANKNLSKFKSVIGQIFLIKVFRIFRWNIHESFSSLQTNNNNK